MHHETVVGNRPGETFLLTECYASIQGESSLVGTPTVFVRLYSCNLRCSWCDSVYAVEGGDYREVEVAELVSRLRELTAAGGGHRRGISHVCWTGGEPLLQWRSVAKAIEGLPPHFVHSMETDGEVDLAPFDRAVSERRGDGRVRYIMDIKCPGSAMVAKRAFENLQLLRAFDEVKFVILDRADYEFARDVVQRREIRAENVLFSPVMPANRIGEGLEPAKLAGWILEDRLDVRLQPQIHKFLWPGKERGI
ncbi:MAG TPA: radical SAM protein [Thermoplasmata archaeon]|nr:radical SAM protein [Thermoplasmata archaeon]